MQENLKAIFAEPDPEKDLTMREYIRENLDELLDFMFEQHPRCELCRHADECDEALHTPGSLKSFMFPCQLNLTVTKENGRRFLASPASNENIDILKKIMRV